MDGEVLEQMLREGKITAKDVLRNTSADRVDGVMEILLRHLPHDEVRGALYARIDGAPLADFEMLRMAYFKHCEHVPSIASASKQSILSYLAAAYALPGEAQTKPRQAPELVRLGGGAQQQIKKPSLG
jgi:hypothetical protein